MKETTYTTCASNGQKYAERIAAQYVPGGQHYTPGNQVRVERGNIPCWGSGIPSSSSFGQSESGYRIVVANNRK